MIPGVDFWEREEIIVGDYFMQHDIFIVLVYFEPLGYLLGEAVLHVLEPLPFEEDVHLVVLYIHYVGAFAVQEQHAVAELYILT